MSTARRATARLILVAAATIPVFAQSVPYGSGSPGTGGVVPSLSAAQPWLGSAGWGVALGHGVGAGGALLFVGPLPAATNFGGLPIWIDLAFALPPFPLFLDGNPGVAGDGDAFLPVPLPPTTSGLAGFEVYWQAAVGDPAGVLGLTVTNGLATKFTYPPQVFVGASVGGSADPAHFANPQTLAFDFPSGGSTFTDNVNGCVYAEEGRKLYVSTGFGKVNVADLTGAAPVWTTLQTFAGSNGVAWQNAQLDPARRLLWSAQKTGANVELVALDVDPASPTYGTVVAATTTVTANVGLIGVWGLSADGARAAVPSLLGGVLTVFDVDPASPTFGAPTLVTPIPSTGASALWLNNAAAFSDDGVEIYVLRQGAAATPSEVARYSYVLNGWIDHDPGTPILDNVGPTVGAGFGPAGASLAVLKDGSGFVVAGGFGAAGWAGRVALDPSNLTSATWTPFTGAATPGSTVATPRLALDLDRARVAVGCQSPLRLKFFDVPTAAFLAEIALPSGGVSNLCWR